MTKEIEKGEITPQMLNLQPYSGSVVVVDVNTGDVITAVSYPSYDNNMFVNGMNTEYYYKVNRDDPTSPILNRAFSEQKAPGSTFKMINVYCRTRKTRLLHQRQQYMTKYSFTKAGDVFRCHSATSHGNINVSTALEVSCNYFFL